MPSAQRLALPALLLVGVLGCPSHVERTEILETLRRRGTPNVVLVVVDTLRADWTAPYGAPPDVSPELARWAAKGVTFERVRSQSSWTKISMASLVTSLWPRSHGIREPGDGLGDAALTLAELFQAAGHATYGVQSNGWLHSSFGFHRGFDRYLFPLGSSARFRHRPSLWPHADRVLDEARRTLDAHPPGRPFFLYLHFMDVHEYAAPPEFKRWGDDDAGAYRAAIRWVDDALLRLRRDIDRRGQLDRTVFVLASDHGEAFGENGLHGHARNVLAAQVQVPLVFRFPFDLDGVRVSTQVRNLDLAPTILELVGLDVPDGFQGRSLVGLMEGRAEPDRPSYARLGQPLFLDALEQASVTDGTWTYARRVQPEDEPDDEGDEGTDEEAKAAPGPGIDELLFDRRTDPNEEANLVEVEPREATRMRALFADEDARRPRAGVRRTGVRIDPKIAERLRALGYGVDP